jgi:hypothetical protein
MCDLVLLAELRLNSTVDRISATFFVGSMTTILLVAAVIAFGLELTAVVMARF